VRFLEEIVRTHLSAMGSGPFTHSSFPPLVLLNSPPQEKKEKWAVDGGREGQLQLEETHEGDGHQRLRL